MTVRPSLSDSYQEKYSVAAILDSASSDWFVTEDLVRRLGLKQFPVEAEIGTVGDGSARATTAVKLRVEKLDNEVEAFVLPRICGTLSTIALEAYDRQTNTLDLTQEPVPCQIDVLIGVAQFFDAIKEARPIEGTPGMCFVETVFGPCLTGETDLVSHECPQTLLTLSNEDLHRYLGRFFSTESIGIISREDDEDSTEEALARKMLFENLKFDETRKRYQAPILFKPNARPLKNNVNTARACLLSLEKRLRKMGLKPMYIDSMNALFERGDAELVPDAEIEQDECFYLPHTVVAKPQRETTKYRLVWNASKANKMGISLNSEILKTPDLIPRLTGILMRFRLPIYAIAGDVSKMFMNIDLPKEDRKYVRFLWRESEDAPIKHYQLTTTNFGLADSPFKAIAITRHHAEKNAGNHPEVVQKIMNDTFVDDIMTGEDTVIKAVKLATNCNETMSKGSFVFRKWVSNSPEVLKLIPEELRGAQGNKLLTRNISLMDDEEGDVDPPKSSALGVEWNIESDRLVYAGFSSIRDDLDRPTKRSMASVAARFFDPLGLICPFTVTGQVLLQQAWLETREWDAPLSEELAQKWNRWLKDVPSLAEVGVPRCIRLPNDPVQSFELHGFGDASETALAACVYARIGYGNNMFRCHLLMAKTRVVKEKERTIPVAMKPTVRIARWELCAAQMVAQLVTKVAQDLSVAKENVTCHTDSLTCWQWLQGDHNRWVQFVTRRCRIIDELVAVKQWRWVRGKENPADLPSRGISAKDLRKNELWFHGPPWLSQPKELWSEEINGPLTEECLSQVKKTTLLAPMVEKLTKTPLLQSLLKISDYQRFLRRTGILLKPLCKRYHQLDEIELMQQAETTWVRLAQMEHLTTDYDELKRGGSVGKASKLKALDPFMDNDGLMRVGGRLQHADLPYDEKFPVILPSIKPKTRIEINDSVVTRLIYHTHVKQMHAGPDWLLHHLRTRYWILSGKKTVQATINKCVACKRAVGRKLEQKMAPLPDSRLQTDVPWACVGVDFTGAFPIRQNEAGQHKKMYVCLFTCMSSRAVHFECTDNLTTETFILALRRMMARRGVPRQMFSDEAKTFVRAARELATLETAVDLQRLDNECTNLGIKWSFNTPFAQWRGGAWERLVRTLKETLRKVLVNTTVDEPTFRTVICEIESFVNDRPLAVVSGTPTDVIPITPSMLTGGRQLRSLPDWARSQKDETTAPIRTMWKHRQALRRQCWRRFQKDYMLRTLTRVPTWREERPSLKVGDVVLVSTEASKRSGWPLATVIEIEDGRLRRSEAVRTVTLRLARGQTLRRPIQHLVNLECS